MLQLPPVAWDVPALAARLLLGAVRFAHDMQKLVGCGLSATSADFAQVGVPLPMLR